MEFVLTKEEVETIGRFDRQFSSEIRALLRSKRESLGASYQQLGSVLQISWSTIHKWETGTTNSCHTRHVERIGRFLKGYYDKQIMHLLSGFALSNQFNNFPDELKELFERIKTVMHLHTNRASASHNYKE
jgi:predicted transcriptional regulator